MTMTITSIGIVANGKEYAEFSFRDPAAVNPYVVRTVVGLDADEVSPRFYAHGSDGTPYFDMAMPNREIVLFAGLNPNYAAGQSTAGLRQDLQKAISASRNGKITLCFKENKHVRAILEGHIVKFEAALFNQEPGVQFTYKCTCGFLRSPDSVDLDMATMVDQLTIVDPLSTAPHGFDFGITFDAAATGFQIVSGDGTTWQVDYAFQTGDKLMVSTGRNPYVTLDRSSVISQLANSIVPGSRWPIMFPEANDYEFKALTDIAFTWDYLKYNYAYWGV